MQKLLGIKEIIERYGLGENFWRAHLCRPEFNKFNCGRYKFTDLPDLHNEIKSLIAKKKSDNMTKWKIEKYSHVAS